MGCYFYLLKLHHAKMEINLSIKAKSLKGLIERVKKNISLRSIVIISIVLSIISTTYFFFNDQIVTYGDAESHLNIAKRVVHSITPGVAQIGGIWLPLPHMMLVPFVYFDFLWRTGLAGSIVSGVSFIVSSVFLYRITYFLTKDKVISFVSFIIFASNPNILYLQSTPMTELVLIMFFLLSTYYFIRFIYNSENIIYLIIAAFFGFCASLSRYDGWFLVLFEAMAIVVLYIGKRKFWREMEGKLFLFSTLAFLGVLLWILWDYLILGDPFYFTNSQFSAKTQQQNWYIRGELPSYHNIFSALYYYFVTSLSNSGFLIFLTSIVGLIIFLKDHFKEQKIYLVLLILFVPFIFNVATLFLGQSVIFIPHITPNTFEWTLFNVRYGVMMIPVVTILFSYLLTRRSVTTYFVLALIFVLQFMLYFVGYSDVITLADGTRGLSKAERHDAEYWLKDNYDDGLVLIDDYARTVSIVRTKIPMQNIIYIGNRKYWEESFNQPEKYATWIVMQRDDAVWQGIYGKPHIQSRLFKYFNKVYTSPDILIFRKIRTT